MWWSAPSGWREMLVGEGRQIIRQREELRLDLGLDGREVSGNGKVENAYRCLGHGAISIELGEAAVGSRGTTRYTREPFSLTWRWYTVSNFTLLRGFVNEVLRFLYSDSAPLHEGF
jgi:hypothetical protein